MVTDLVDPSFRSRAMSMTASLVEVYEKPTEDEKVKILCNDGTATSRQDAFTNQACISAK
jgi:hypothetical protein